MANKGIKKYIGDTAINFGILFGVVLVLLWIINPPGRPAVGINIVLLLMFIAIYSIKAYDDDKIPLKLRLNDIGIAFAFGFLLTSCFFIITSFIPGLSIGIPVLPNSISGELQFFLVVIVAPIVETLFFQGAVFAYFLNFNPSKKLKWLIIIVQALIFALAHLGAYVAGFYAYPGWVEGFSALGDNISAFITAFVFALIAGGIASKKGIENLLVAMLFHLGMNLISYSLSVAVFIVSLPIIKSNHSLLFIPTMLIGFTLLNKNKGTLYKEKSV